MSHKDIKEKNSKKKATERSEGVPIDDSRSGKVVTVKKEEYEKLKGSARLCDEFKDKYLRVHAELDNARKRFVKEKEDYVRFANEELLNEILYVVDNFDRALEHMNETQKVESILEGIKMIKTQFHWLLEQKGVRRIEAIGKKFDPALHEAIEHIETDEDKEGVIIEEVQAGYLLNGRLLRPAVVKVGKKKTGEDKTGR